MVCKIAIGMLINTHLAITHYYKPHKSACKKKIKFVYKLIYSIIQTIVKYGQFLMVEYRYKDIHGVYFFLHCLDYSSGVWSSDSEELHTVEHTVPYSSTSRTTDSITDSQQPLPTLSRSSTAT